MMPTAILRSMSSLTTKASTLLQLLKGAFLCYSPFEYSSLVILGLLLTLDYSFFLILISSLFRLRTSSSFNDQTGHGDPSFFDSFLRVSDYKLEPSPPHPSISPEVGVDQYLRDAGVLTVGELLSCQVHRYAKLRELYWGQ